MQKLFLFVVFGLGIAAGAARATAGDPATVKFTPLIIRSVCSAGTSRCQTERTPGEPVQLLLSDFDSGFYWGQWNFTRGGNGAPLEYYRVTVVRQRSRGANYFSLLLTVGFEANQEKNASLLLNFFADHPPEYFQVKSNFVEWGENRISLALGLQEFHGSQL